MDRDGEAGLTGVGVFITWISLIVASLCVKHHPVGLWIVGCAGGLWAAAAIWYPIRRIRQGVSAYMFETDMGLVLPVVALALTGMWASQAHGRCTSRPSGFF